MDGDTGRSASEQADKGAAANDEQGFETSLDAADKRRPKTAVVLIHGMGEQRPMATLWGFVDAVWSTDRSLIPEYDAAIYAKPDTINDSVDLRRVTTRYWEGPSPRRVDFFEYYWAHMMRGNSVKGAIDWILSLFLRSPSSVPSGLRKVWVAGLVFLLAAITLFAVAAVPKLVALILPKAMATLLLEKNVLIVLGGFSTLSSVVAARWLAPVAGDAARYFSADPDNVEARQRIIRTGVDVIEKLTASREYDRIIVVGHSLGSAIGLDILNQAFGRVRPDTWARVHTDPVAARALADLEKHGAELNRAASLSPASYRRHQNAYAASLRKGWQTGDAAWLVSDFVTLGSPLSKAHVLLARTLDAFTLLLQRRQEPSCPPIYEKADPPSFSFTGRGRVRIPHFGAVFAPTRWTNLFFKSHAIVFGDIIAGPVAPLFGKGVEDIELPQPGLRFRHLDYWRGADAQPTAPWIEPLRDAVDLRGKGFDSALAEVEAAVEASQLMGLPETGRKTRTRRNAKR